MEYDMLIEGGTLLTMAQDLPVIEKGGVLIKDGVIEDCGDSKQFSSLSVRHRINAENKIILPGLINCHTHLPMSMFRGLADDLPLDVWLNDHIFPAEAKYINPESVEKWSLHSCHEMLLAGTTCCCDGYFHEDKVVRAIQRSGIRAVTGQGVIDFPAPGVPDPEKNIETADNFVKQVKEIGNRIMPSVFCHSPYTCSKNTLIRAKNAAREQNALFQIHVAETKHEINMVEGLDGMSVVQYLDKIGVLDDQTMMIHAVWVDDRDMDIMAKRGVSVAHCPESNMKLASGVAPVPEMIKRGIAVGIGTDGCASNNDHDLFCEMDMAAKLHKVTRMDPCVMDARTTLKLATIEAARAIGISSQVGSIERGKRADMILVDLDKPHLTPMYDPYSAVVYSAKSSDVSLVVVDGDVLVENQKLSQKSS